MANNLIPEELNALIQQYLTDGVLTDKERQVILNKAEKMGLDRDEIDLYLDAQVQKIDQATDAAVRKQKGKQCPYCGGSIPLLTDKCPHCGENITPEASSELQEILDNLEEALVNLKSGKDIHASKATVERFSRKAKMYYGSNPKVQKLLEEITNETIAAEKRAKTLVRNRGILNFVKEHTKMTLFLGLIALLALFWGIRKIVTSFDETKNASACIQAINKSLEENDLDNVLLLYKNFNVRKDREKVINAIESKVIDCVKNLIAEGNLDKAEQYFEFTKNDKLGMDYDTQKQISDAIAKAYYNNGDIEKALFLDTWGYGIPYEDSSDLRKTIHKDYIKKGEYIKAMDVFSWPFLNNDEIRYFEEFIYNCLDQMRKNGEEEKTSSFLEQAISRLKTNESVVRRMHDSEYAALYKEFEQRVRDYAKRQ